MKRLLNVKALKTEARKFAIAESRYPEPKLFGVTDGKAVGTYFEQKFRNYLTERYEFELGNSAKGIDFPDLDVDMKVTSVRQPQSSCPFKLARQKVYGLGYSVLVFVYDKYDDPDSATGTLKIVHVIFVESRRTADFQTTRGLLEILDRDGNEDDVVAFIQDRCLPVDEVGARLLAKEILDQRPEAGYLTISNALQWRLQYGRVITSAGDADGVLRLV